MPVLKVKMPDGSWGDITGTGAQGPPGGPVPVGGNPGEVIVKTGSADMEVGWAPVPRVAHRIIIASAVGGAASTMSDIITGTVTIDPTRYYHIFASVRCISDPGATAMAQFQVHCGVDLLGYDVVNTAGDPNQLWGAWSENWLEPGDALNTSGVTAAVTCKLRGMCTVAGLTFYTPRLYVLEYGAI